MKKLISIIFIVILSQYIGCGGGGGNGSNGDNGAIAPEINVKKDTTNIPSGGNIDIGSSVVGVNKQITFTIYNLGDDDLILSVSPYIEIGGVDADEFIAGLPIDNIISPGSSTEFTIDFIPDSVGVKSATVTILNNDSDEGTYTFTIDGTGTATPENEINVRQGSTDLPDGSGSYSFGNVAVDGDGGITSGEITFTIENIGTADLAISNVYLSAGDTTDFDLTDNTSSPVSPSGSTTFIIRFDPLTVGSKLATVTIDNDDSDENPYTFTVTGNRITDLGDGTVYDRITGLYWKKCSQGQNDDATCSGTALHLQYCDANDNSCNSTTTWLLDGTGNSQVWDTCNSCTTASRTWRAPTIDELYEFYYNVYSPYIDLFPNTELNFYWSSSALEDVDWWDYAWVFGVHTGWKAPCGKTITFWYVRCVSGP